MSRKINLTEISVGDTIQFSSPGFEPVTAEVAEIVSLQPGGLRKSIFMNAEGILLNPRPDGGTDALLVRKGPPTPEELKLERRYAEEFNKFSSKPVGSMYMLSSHKSTGTVLIRISDTRWIYYDYSGYGGYDAYTMGHEEAFNYCYDNTDGYFFADEMDVSGVNA